LIAVHKSSYNAGAPPVLCIYDPPFPLVQALKYNIANDVCGEENVASLKGYINIQIGNPVMNGQDSVPLSLISRVSPGSQNFNKESLAIQLASCIKDIMSHPELYNIAHTSLDGLYLEKITYDMKNNTFKAHLCYVP